MLQIGLENRLKKHEIEKRRFVKENVDTSRGRKVEELPNGDRLISGGNIGYVVDGATGELKRWLTRKYVLGGPSSWKEAEFCWNNVIGPGRNYAVK